MPIVGLMDNQKKRKGYESDQDSVQRLTRKAKTDLKSGFVRCHLSLEDRMSLKKIRCMNVCSGGDDGVGCSGSNVGPLTVPLHVGLSSKKVVQRQCRGLKRKIGCLDVATQMGRKNKLEDDYVMIEMIGKGKYGSVWSCRDRVCGEDFACKSLPKGEETVHREVEIMQHLSGHPGIVLLNAVYEDPERYHLVMELCTGGRLVDQMKAGSYSEQQAACLLKDLMMVIKYCHETGVVHRDIKPENILLTSSGKIKLADFGLAVRVAEGQILNGVAGSPSYMAPEVISGEYREKVDIWSAGVLLHALLTGSLPFHGSSIEKIFDAVKKAKLDFHSGMWESISEPARDLLERMMTRDVSARITAQEVLEHPWIVFYTEHTIRPFNIKAKAKPRLVVVAPERAIGNSRVKANSGSVNKCSCIRNSSVSNPSSGPCDTCNSESHKGCDLLDALTAAISRVSLSERKSTRLRVMSSIPQQYSGNSLCKAF